MQNESSEGAASTGGGNTNGVQQDPHRVTVTTSGRAASVGSCTPIREQVAKTSRLTWYRYDIDSLLFSHRSAMLILQGMSLGRFFEDVDFKSTEPPFSLGGSFVFLRGALSSFDRPPLKLVDIVIGRIGELNEPMEHSAILADLLEDVLLHP